MFDATEAVPGHTYAAHSTGDWHFTRCSCGWQSHPHDAAQPAIDEAESHLDEIHADREAAAWNAAAGAALLARALGKR